MIEIAVVYLVFAALHGAEIARIKRIQRDPDLWVLIFLGALLWPFVGLAGLRSAVEDINE